MNIMKTAFDKVEKVNLILFSAGEFISLFGSAIYSFVISLYVLRLTGSGLSFAITLVQGVLPTVIIGPFAGALADRFNKKLLVIIMDIANAVLFALIFVTSSFYGLTLPIIYVTTFMMNAITVIFGISIESAKPNLVTDDNLIKINLISQLIKSMSSILGPILGGMVFAFVDIKYFILINGLSFFCSGVSEIFMNFNFNTKRESSGHAETGDLTIKSITSDIRAGFLYTFRQRELKDTLSVFVILNIILGFSAMVSLPYAINNVMNLGSVAYGFVEGFFPVGMILGAIVVERIYREALYKKIINLSTLILSVVIIAMGIPLLGFAWFSKELCVAFYSMLMVITGGIISFVDIPTMQKLQTTASEEYRGRVISTSICACKIALPIALIISGFIIELVPVLWIFLGIGCLSMLYAIYRCREAYLAYKIIDAISDV